jgi:hypothetical protein
MTSPRRKPQHRTPQPAEPFSPRQLSEEELLELRDLYGDAEEPFPERPDGWPHRPPEYVIVLAASDWYKEHFPAAGPSLWDALNIGHDHHLDPEQDPKPDLEAEP